MLRKWAQDHTKDSTISLSDASTQIFLSTLCLFTWVGRVQKRTVLQQVGDKLKSVDSASVALSSATTWPARPLCPWEAGLHNPGLDAASPEGQLPRRPGGGSPARNGASATRELASVSATAPSGSLGNQKWWRAQFREAGSGTPGMLSESLYC